MESNPATLAGAARSAMRCIGQAPQRTRWTDLAHRRPVFRVRRTSLCSTCGQKDHGVKHASLANAKNRSKGSIVSSFGMVLQKLPATVRCLRFADGYITVSVTVCKARSTDTHELLKLANPHWIRARVRTCAADDGVEKSILCRGRLWPPNSMIANSGNRSISAASA